jgi:hypothetical protein
MAEDIACALRRLERSHYEYSLGHQGPAKKLCLNAISSLNSILRSSQKGDDTDVITRISQNALQFYESVKSNDKLSIDERITWISSSLNGSFFPPMIYEETSLQTSTELNDLLKLSTSQEELLEKWIEIDHQDWSTDGLDDIYQDFLQDCSFVVALISLSRNNKQFLLDKITPHSNNSKRFGVVLHFNGCKRLVETGNSLPLLKSRSLFIRSKSNDQLYWPALLEKSYLKVLGNGYDSIGSNASIDTYFISGWIPEFVSSSIERPDFHSLWDDLYDKFQNNKLVLAIGTGDSAGTGYHKNHDYAIVDLISESKSIVVKNPWNTEVTTVNFHEIFDSFKTLYINWNMSEYYHESKNLIWNLKFPETQFSSFINFPQFGVKNESARESEFFVLLERHVGFSPSDIRLMVYETSHGEKVFTRAKPLVRSLGNNSGFHLTKFTLQGLRSATLVVVNDSNTPQNHTLHVYSDSPDFKFFKSGLELPFLKQIVDKWGVDSCGGNWSHQTYIKNPQYEIMVPDYPGDVVVKIGLFTKNDVLVNFQLFWNSERNKPYDQTKASLVNEKYKTGTVIHQLRLKSNQSYKLILSTYDTDILEDFRLIINSEIADLTVNKLSTNLGLYLKPFKFNWNNKNRFKLNFKVPRQSTINVHLWTNQNSVSVYRPKIRASLFYQGGEVIEVNPEFSDNLYGIWLESISIKPETMVILLIERFEAGNDDTFGEIGSDFKIELV